MTEFEAAENEARNVGPTLEIAGREVQFPAKLPPGIAAATQMQRADLIYKTLAGGDEELLDFLILNLQEEDFDRVAEAYGLGDTGNSPASDTSS